MYLYQKIISAQLSSSCAFNPSCSQYSKDLIKEYGIIKGTFLSSDRITRCTRISLADKSSYHFDKGDGKMHERVDRYRNNHKDSNRCNH
ncbi:MAG TPA: membrane protein insertion efficiency factor YidD [Bacteroidales bacterium]|nr:membrane protein insertion efficiency factor YidD [Bacteroidales bacterium]